jgi:hypothetical protein
MNFISKSVSHPRAVGGFAAILATVAFLAALALAGPTTDEAFESAQVAPVDQSALDPGGLALAMSLETSRESAVDSDDEISELPFTSGVEQTPEQQQAATPACTWDGSDAAVPCMIDWPYQDARVAQAAPTTCYDDFGDVTECSNDRPYPDTLMTQAADDSTVD